MAELLTPGEINEFFAAIGDVTDTFFKNTIVYERTARTMNEFNESATSKTDYSLLCRVTMLEDEVSEIREGTYDDSNLEVSFNGEYLTAQGLMAGPSLPIFDEENDYFRYAGKRYKLLNVSASDSDFTGKVALVRVKLRKERETE